MSRLILTCWKCGHKFDKYGEDVTLFHPACPKCGALVEDAKKSVRMGKVIGNGMMVIGMIVGVLSLYVPISQGLDPNGKLLALWVVIAIIGFLVKLFTRPLD